MTGPRQDAQPRDGEALAHAVMVLAALIFGINYVVGRWATGEVPAYTLGFVRWTCGALILLPFAWRRIAADRAWIAAPTAQIRVSSVSGWYPGDIRRTATA